MMHIDGSEKSGSGTIVRYAAAISSLLSIPIHLTNIRAKREKQGLRPQHLKAIAACAEMTGGIVEGLEVGSREIRYYPKSKICGGEYLFNIGTAGSATMLTQSVLPIACFASGPCKITIKGGLFQDFAPSFHHLKNVIFPLLKIMHVDADIMLIRPGYVPHGEGIIQLFTKPMKTPLNPLQQDNQGQITSIKGVALSSHLEDRKVSERMAVSCNQNLQQQFNSNADITCIYENTAEQAGAVLCVFATTQPGCILGADMAGKLGRSSEFIGEKVAQMLVEDLKSDATVDRHTADQLILYAGLAKGKTSYKAPEITDHIETNIWLIEKMLKAKCSIDSNRIEIDGIGFQ